MANVVDADFRRSGEFSFDFNCLKFEFSFSSIFSGKKSNFFWYFHIRGFLLTSLKNLNPLLISIAKFRILLLNDLFEIEGWIFFWNSGSNDDQLYTELWKACAGPLVEVPRYGDRVFYFPQGHMEQVKPKTIKLSKLFLFFSSQF